MLVVQCGFALPVANAHRHDVCCAVVVTTAVSRFLRFGLFRGSHVAELGRANIDEGRLVQAISNLLSNARQHGDLRFPIRINAFRARSEQRIEISNRLAAGQHFLPGAMTSPLKPSSAVNARNKTGLGLGLYIANAIVGGHDGELKSQCVGGEVTFSIVLNSVNSDASEVGTIAICA